MSVDSYPLDRHGNQLIPNRNHNEPSQGFIAPLTGAFKGEEFYQMKASVPYLYGQKWELSIPRHQSPYDNSKGYTVKIWVNKNE